MNNSALLVIDVQNGFITSETAHLPALIAAFLRGRHGDYALVIATRFENAPGSLYETSMGWCEMRGPLDTALAPEIAPLVHEVSVKHGYAPAMIDLVARLQRADIERVDLCGIDTDQCVLATAIALWDAGIEPRILSNLCASTGGPSAHEAGLLVARRAIGRRNVVVLA